MFQANACQEDMCLQLPPLIWALLLEGSFGQLQWESSAWADRWTEGNYFLKQAESFLRLQVSTWGITGAELDLNVLGTLHVFCCGRKRRGRKTQEKKREEGAGKEKEIKEHVTCCCCLPDPRFVAQTAAPAPCIGLPCLSMAFQQPHVLKSG